MNFRNCIYESLPLFSAVMIFVVVLCLLYASLGIGVDKVDGDYPGVDVVTSTFFFVFENSLGTPKKPPMGTWRTDNNSEFGNALAAVIRYVLYFLWMAHQYWMYTFLFMFFTVVIIKTYKKSLKYELVYSYKKKAELNKFYLIFNQAWGRDEQIECFLLSANTVEKEHKWDTFTNQFKE